jgi:CRP-like cAMP-binding protein
VRVWTTDFAADMRVRDRVRSHIYYAFRRHGISIPYPIQVQIEQSPADDVGTVHARLLDGVEIFAALTGEQREQLAAASRALLFEAGQDIVREGEAGTSMFVLKRGEAVVTLAHTVGEVARHHEGGFFGEMSLLTGDARSATVTAATDCELIEIGADAFRRVVLADAAILHQVTAAVSKRRLQIAQHRATKTMEPPVVEPPQTLVDRVRRFLRL